MPSGRTHDLFNVGMLLVLAIGVALYSFLADNMDEDVLENCLFLFLGAYFFSTFLLSPDLDLKKNRSKLNWGFLRWIWWPYSKTFKHRGLSHSLIWGIPTRLIFIYLIYFSGLMVFYVLGDYYFEEMPFWFVDADNFEVEYVAALLLGVYLPSITHSLLDVMVTHEKKAKRQKK